MEKVTIIETVVGVVILAGIITVGLVKAKYQARTTRK